MSLLAGLDGGQRTLAARPFADDAARRWLEYRPRRRPGACIAELSGTARKAAHRLLATGLSEHAYAQAMSIVALEEVLYRKERWRRGRHSGDYWVSVYGDPEGSQPWSWRFEGHHLSVTMTVAGDEVGPPPPRDGAAGPSRPPWWSGARSDIQTATSPRARENIEPLGVAAADLRPGAQAAAGPVGRGLPRPAAQRARGPRSVPAGRRGPVLRLGRAAGTGFTALLPGAGR